MATNREASHAASCLDEQQRSLPMEQHPNVRLTTRGREALASRIESGVPVADAALQMGVSQQTASKCLRRSRSW